MKQIQSQVFALFLLLAASSCMTAQQRSVDALIVIDIDHTLGVQSVSQPDFAPEIVVHIPNDKDGSFYFYKGSIDFLETLFSWRDDAASQGKKVEIALFTMAIGERNEVIRNFIEDKLAKSRSTLGLYDYGDAVFSEELVTSWKSGNPSLSSGWTDYLSSLKRPLRVEKLPAGIRYFKDLSNLLGFYEGLKLENVRLVDDNDKAVPDSQKHQHIVFGPQIDYLPALTQLKDFLSLW